MPPDLERSAREIVERFQEASMVPDPVAARTFMAPDVAITFTGGRVVYNTGTLYGAWPDGTPFEGNRYVDRFVLSGGKIVRMDVWNDSAEILLARAGLAEDGESAKATGGLGGATA